MSTRAELRARARQTLGGSIFATPWLIVLLAIFAVSSILGLSGNLIILPLVLTGPAYIGLYTYLIKFVRGQNPLNNIDPIFDGFRGKVSENIILGILHGLFIFLWSLLFIIPGIVKSYSYAMAYYIKIDNPDISANDAITESRKMMDGQKMRLFLLDLSFIGWMILGVLALGIGVLWVDAYKETTRIHFYEELKAKRAGYYPPVM